MKRIIDLETDPNDIYFVEEELNDTDINKWKHVRGMNIKIVVDDKNWQNLRKTFVGTWKKEPVKNIKELRDYVGDMTCPYKTRRVLNYLTGTAFRIGKISHLSIDKLLNEIRIVYNLKTNKNK